MRVLCRALAVVATLAAASAECAAEPLRATLATLAGDPAAWRAFDREAGTTWCPGRTAAILRFAAPVHPTGVRVVRPTRDDGVLYTPLTIETDAGRTILSHVDDGQPVYEDEAALAGATQVVRVFTPAPARGARDCVGEVVIDTLEGPLVFAVSPQALAALDRALDSPAPCRPLPRAVRAHSSFEGGRPWFVQRKRRGDLGARGTRAACAALAARTCGADERGRCSFLLAGVAPGIVRVGMDNHLFVDLAWRRARWQLVAFDDASFE